MSHVAGSDAYRSIAELFFAVVYASGGASARCTVSNNTRTLAARGESPVGRAARDLRLQARREEKAMLTHCVDEQRSMQPQTPAARRVAAARAHLLRCASSEMEGIAFVGTPRIWPRGARNAAHATFASGC